MSIDETVSQAVEILFESSSSINDESESMSNNETKRGPGRPPRPINQRRMIWKISLTQQERDEILQKTKTISLTEAVRKMAKEIQ